MDVMCELPSRLDWTRPSVAQGGRAPVLAAVNGGKAPDGARLGGCRSTERRDTRPGEPEKELAGDEAVAEDALQRRGRSRSRSHRCGRGSRNSASTAPPSTASAGLRTSPAAGCQTSPRSDPELRLLGPPPGTSSAVPGWRAAPARAMNRKRA